MLNPTDLSIIRTKLRAVNVEYSALVKAKAGEGRFVRMHELKTERQALMALMAGARGAERMLHIGPRQQPVDAVIQNPT